MDVRRMSRWLWKACGAGWECHWGEREEVQVVDAGVRGCQERVVRGRSVVVRPWLWGMVAPARAWEWQTEWIANSTFVLSEASDEGLLV